MSNNRTFRIVLYVIIGCVLLAAITAHVVFLWWERDGFAVGSEWIIYYIVAMAFFCRVLGYDD